MGGSQSTNGLASFWSEYARGADLPQDPHVARGGDGLTPLAYAASVGNVDACRLLLDRGAHSNSLIAAPDSDGRTPIWHAVSGGHREALRLLFERTASLAFSATGLQADASYSVEPCALYKAASSGEAETLKRLLAARQGFDEELNREAHAAQAVRSYAGVCIAAARAGGLALTRLLLDSWPAPRGPPPGSNYDAEWRWRQSRCPENELEKVRYGWLHEQIYYVLCFCAAESGSVELTRYLLERGPKKPPKKDGGEEDEASGGDAKPEEGPGGLLISERVYPLHGAAGAGRLEALKYLVEERKENPRVHRRRLGTPLNLAARFGHAAAVQYLLEHGAGAKDGEPQPPTAGDEGKKRGYDYEEPWPSLLEAAAGGHLDVLKILLDRGADSNAKGILSRERRFKGTASALEIAAERGHVECVRLLAQRGADVAACGQSAALLAAAAGETEVLRRVVPPLLESVRLLWDHRALKELGVNLAAPFVPPKGDSKYGPKEGYSALHAAAASARPACVKALLDMGVPVSLPTEPVAGAGGGLTPLHLAVSCGIASFGINFTRRSPFDDESRPMHAKASQLLEGDVVETARVLLEAGAELEAKTKEGKTPLQVALAASPPEAVVVDLLSRGASVENSTGDVQLHPMNLAARNSSTAVLRTILERKPNMADARPVNALSRKNLVALRELLAAGAPPAGLLVAAFQASHDDETIRMIVEAGADVNEESPYGSPLGYACGHRPDGSRRLEIVQMLLDRGAEVKDTTFRSALGAAQRAETEEGLAIVKLLLSRGARVDVAYKRQSQDAIQYVGGEPIHDACRDGKSVRLVDLLLASGASLEAQDEEGMTPLGAARGGAAHVRSHLIKLEDEACGRAGPPRPPILRGVAKRYYELNGRLALDSREPRLYGRAGGFLATAAAVAADGLVDEVRACLDMALLCKGAFWTGDFAATLKAAAGSRGGPIRALAHGAMRLLALEGPDRLLRRRFRGGWFQSQGKFDDGGEEDGGYEKPAAGGGEGGGGDAGESALLLACRHGFRHTALRLAREASDAAVDAADARGETPLYNAVACGPAMLDVCTLLIQRGADPARSVGQGPSRRMVVQAHPDVSFQAALKRASGLRDAFISHAPEDAAFARRLHAGLEAAHLTCALDDPSEADESAGLKKAQALIFVVSDAARRSARCRAQLAAARRLGRAVYPVWREKCALDDQLQGALMKQQFADLSTDALFAAGLPPFALTLTQRLATGGAAGAGPAGQEALAQAAAALLATPGARCDVEEPSPFLFVWCHAADASFAEQFVRGLAHRGARCWLDCSGGGTQRPPSAGAVRGGGDDGAQAVVKCSAFVPLLSKAAIADPLLRDRLQLAELNKRPLRPVVVSDRQAVEGLYPDSQSRAYMTKGNVALLANLDALLESLPNAAALGLRPASAGQKRAEAAAAAGPAVAVTVTTDVPYLERALAERRERIARAQRRIEELRVAAAAGGGGGGGGGRSKACTVA
eukprot:tig00000158_g10180.t1